MRSFKHRTFQNFGLGRRTLFNHFLGLNQDLRLNIPIGPISEFNSKIKTSVNESKTRPPMTKMFCFRWSANIAVQLPLEGCLGADEE